jgi:hypothetical protein
VSAEIITLNMETWLDIPADRVLEGVMGKLSTVLLVGYDSDEQPYFAASTSNKGDMLLMIERLRKRLLED